MSTPSREMFRAFCIAPMAATSFFIMASPLLADPVSTYAKLESITKIWDSAPYNSFTDLAYFNGAFYTTFREAIQHTVPDLGQPGGKVRILKSVDGVNWNSVALFDPVSANHDLRGPKLVATTDNQLMLLATDVPQSGSGGSRRSYTWFSDDGSAWSSPTVAMPDTRWLWRADQNPYDNQFFGVSYAFESTSLLISQDGKSFSNVITSFSPGNEAGILFRESGETVVLIRDDVNNTTRVGTSTNYLDWTFKDTGQFLGGPDIIELPDGRVVAGGRVITGNTQHMSLGFLDPVAGTLSEFLALPSGGDSSYPGLVWHDNSLWVSYYSSHEGSKARIYFANVSFSAPTEPVNGVAYHETFSIGDGSAVFPLVSSGTGWNAYEEEAGTGIPVQWDSTYPRFGVPSSSDPEEGPINSNPLFAEVDPARGNFYAPLHHLRGALFYQDEYTFDLAPGAQLGEISMLTDMDLAESIRAVVQIDGNWYVSDAVSSPIDSNYDLGGRMVWDVDALTWYDFAFVPNASWSIGGVSSLPTTGTVQAVGVYIPALDTGGVNHNYRMDNFKIVLAGLVGDLDGDGFVGISDLNIVLGAWNQNVTPGDALSGDPSGDGFVGIDDLNAVLGNWNAGTPPASVVPEPVGAAFFSLVALVILPRRM